MKKAKKSATPQERRIKFLQNEVDFLQKECAVLREQNDLIRSKSKEMFEELGNKRAHIEALAKIRRRLSQIDDDFAKINVPISTQIDD